MIRLDLTLPLGRFTLAVQETLGEGVTALMGPSGSGKTSLLEAIAGLRRGTRGFIEIDGRNVIDLPPERRHIGYVPQDPSLFPHLSVRKNILYARADTTRMNALAAILELAPLLDRQPGAISGGERQRVALARALMSSPALLLLDEPLAALDESLRSRVLSFLRRVREQERVPMLYVTHHSYEAMAIASECLVLDRGAVVASGAPGKVLHGAAENVFEVDEPEHDPAGGTTRVRNREGVRISLPHDQVRSASFPLVVRISGDDIMLFAEEPRSISSRNVLAGTIEAIDHADGVSLLLVNTPTPFRVRLTRAAVDELRLRVGAKVWLALRTRAFRIVA